MKGRVFSRPIGRRRNLSGDTEHWSSRILRLAPSHPVIKKTESRTSNDANMRLRQMASHSVILFPLTMPIAMRGALAVLIGPASTV